MQKTKNDWGREAFDSYQKAAKNNLRPSLENYHELVGWDKIKHQHRFGYITGLIPKLKGIDAVLDVGCGSGIYVHHFKKLGKTARGIDFSPAQIKNCWRIFGLTADEAKVGNILHIDEPDGSYDLVMSIGTHLIVGNAGKGKAEKAIDELVRVSRRYILIDWGNSDWPFNFRYPSPTQKIWSRQFLKHICKKHHLRVLKEKRFNLKSWLNAICQLPFLQWTNWLHMDSVMLLEKIRPISFPSPHAEAHPSSV